MDALVTSVFSNILEKSVVAGAFLYLLYYLVSKNNHSMELISHNLTKFGDALNNVSQTLLRIDTRIELMEERIKHLEGIK